MKKSMYKKGIVVGLIVLFLGASVIPGTLSEFRQSKNQPLPGSRSFLLIPDSTTKTVGMYSPGDGTYLGNLITDTVHFSTPLNAVKGPDGNIYVSDQVADSVFVYAPNGTYLYTYADSTDGLDNLRGIAFRGTELFISNGGAPMCIARFAGPHIRLPNFIADGIAPFDILFLPDGRSLVADIGTTDSVRLYNPNGTFIQLLFTINFPEQISFDSLLPGQFLVAGFSANIVRDFELDGTIVQNTPYSGTRGVYRLGNGNLLVTSGSGIQEIQPGTGTIIQTEKTGSGRFIELFSTGPNQAPNVPSNPSPANGANNVILNAVLSWTGGDPDPGDLVTYDVYFGTTSPPPKLVSNQSTPSYAPTMIYNQQYYWKIVSWDNHGLNTAGPLWNFTTVVNSPPNTPSNPNPGNGATNVSNAAVLSWTGGDPNPGDLVTYDVYFGTSIPPLKVATNLSSPTYTPVGMTYNEQYYWKIIAWDNGGLSATGPLWVFSTITDTTPPNSHHQLAGTMGNNNWYKSCVTITLQATDNVSGIDASFYKLDSGNWTEYTIPIKICTDGQHQVWYYSIDKAGNKEADKGPFGFKMDKTAPEWINYSFTKLNLLGTKWMCAANVTDATSGIVKVEFYVDDALVANDTEAPYEFEFHGKPTTSSQAIAYDAAGNSAMSLIASSLEYSNQAAQQQSHPSTQTVQKKNI